MPTLGPLEILIILVVAVLVLPPDKLPQVARQAGRALSALRRFQGTLTADLERLVEERDETPKLPPKAGPAKAGPATPGPATDPDEDGPGTGDSGTGGAQTGEESPSP